MFEIFSDVDTTTQPGCTIVEVLVLLTQLGLKGTLLLFYAPEFADDLRRERPLSSLLSAGLFLRVAPEALGGWYSSPVQ